METANVNIALISSIDDERSFYQSILEPYKHLTIEPYSSIGQFKNGSVGKKYSGVIIDMYTIVSSSTAEKDFFFSMQKGFPVMQIRRGLETDEIKGLINQQRVDGASGSSIVETFIRSNCQKALPRGIRTWERKKVLLQIHFLLTQDDPPIQSQLLDLSEGGCFILSPKQPLIQENRIWITIDDLKDKNPIPCKIRWKKDMTEKEKHQIGLGVQFEALTPDQQKEILEVLKATNPMPPSSAPKQ